MYLESKQFPIPDDRVVLLDLDGTLIDQDYKFTDDGIFQAVKDAEEAGWSVGLSSDTPYESLAIWRQRLGMNGPIVAERGALTETADTLFYDRQEAATFAKARTEICGQWRDMGVNIWQGNPVEAIRNNDKLGEPGEAIVLANILRRCSLGFHFRQVLEDGTLTINQSLTEKLTAEARPLYPSFMDLSEDLNHDYGLVIVSRESANKREGTKKLSSILQVGKIAMVGNAMSDYLGGDLAFHYAVADATDGFKSVADYIAGTPLTGGAVEILRGMANAG